MPSCCAFLSARPCSLYRCVEVKDPSYTRVPSANMWDTSNRCGSSKTPFSEVTIHRLNRQQEYESEEERRREGLETDVGSVPQHAKTRRSSRTWRRLEVATFRTPSLTVVLAGAGNCPPNRRFLDEHPTRTTAEIDSGQHFLRRKCCAYCTR